MAKKVAPKADPKPEAKPAPKKADAKAAPAAKGVKAKGAAKAKPKTKAEIFAELAETTELSKKQVAHVFDAMAEMIAKDLSKKGPRVFIVPGLLKLRVVEKKATKEKQGINPATGEPITIAAKPARDVVKAVPLKALKDLI